MPFFVDHTDYIVLNIRVVPRAVKDGVQGLLGDALKVRIQAPPVDGKANVYLMKYLSRHWNIPRSDMMILSGEAGRNKRLRINNPSAELRKELLSFGNG